MAQGKLEARYTASLAGIPVGADEAYSNALIQRGYVVFERPWEAESGEFVKKAVL